MLSATFRYIGRLWKIPAPSVRSVDSAHFALPDSAIYFAKLLGKVKRFAPSDLLEQPNIHGKSFRTEQGCRNGAFQSSIAEQSDMLGNTVSSPFEQNTQNVNFDILDLLLPFLQPPIDYDFADVLDLPPQCTLHAYQWKGIEFLAGRESALLGDDMGTGKTIQSLIACRTLFQRGYVHKALIVTPLSVLTQWHRETEKWAPALHALVVRGTPEYRKQCWNAKTHVWLTTYDALRQDITYLVDENKHQFDLVLLDEVQKIKNRDSRISQAVRKLVCQYRWGLSGTPVENRIDDLLSIFSFLKPKLFRSKDVTAQYARNRIKPYFLRRKLQDVREDLPEKNEFDVWLTLGEEQQGTYDQMERDRVLQLHDQEEITAFKIISLIGELKKICNRDPNTGESAKMDWLREKLLGISKRGDKVLVFTQYVQERFGGREFLVSKLLKEFGALNYGGDPSARARVVQQFEIFPENHVLVAHPNAVLGENSLVVANWGVHFDHWWNPAVTNQATARLRRPGQEKEVLIYHLWVENTVEAMIRRKIEAKKKLYDEVIDSLSDDAAEKIGAEIDREVYEDLLKKHGFSPSPSEEAPQTGGQHFDRPFQESVLEMSPREFEELVAVLFSKMGYNTTLTPQAHDGGVDVIASKRGGEKLAIQCKLQQNPVGRPVLQNLLGVISADQSYSRGVIVTNAEASRGASAMAERNGRLVIMTGRELESLLIQHDILPAA